MTLKTLNTSLALFFLFACVAKTFYSLRIRKENDAILKRITVRNEINLSGSNKRRLQEIIDEYPDSPEPLKYSINISHQAGNWEKLYADALNFYQRFPHLPDGWAGLGLSLRYMKRFDEAEKILLTGLRKCSGNAEIAIELGLLLHDQSKFDEAIIYWSKLRKSHSRNSLIYRHLAYAFIVTGQFDRASALMSEALFIFPDDPNVAIKHAETATASKSWSEAVQRWTHVTVSFPGRWEGYCYLSEALYHLGKRDQAIMLLETAKAAFPNNRKIQEEYDRQASPHIRDASSPNA